MHSRLAAFAVSLAACLVFCPVAALHTPVAASEHRGPGRLNFSWPVNVGPLNPHLYGPNQMFAQAMVYEPLVRYRADGTIAPWLATSWNISDDGRIYTFHLRPGVKFSNGEAFDADAVVANIRAVLDNRASHTWLELANQIHSVEAIDPHTVKLSLKQPYYPALLELSLPRPFRFAAPSRFRDGGTRGGVTAPVGTGPWTLAQSQPGVRDLFARNETYWGKRPAYAEINVKIVPDPNTRAIAFETGDIDLIYGSEGPVSLDTFQRFSKMKTVSTGVSVPMETVFLAMNSNSGPTSDVRARTAINHAVDKDALAARVLHGTQPRADTLFAPGTPYADIGLKPYAYDPARAAALLTDAGWTLDKGARVRTRNGIPLHMELCFIGNDAQSKAMAEVIQSDLGKIGIGVALVGEEESSINARQHDGRFGMIFGRTWGAPYDPHAYVSSMRAPAHADFQAQRGLPDKAEIDANIGKALIATDVMERQRLYRDILTRLHQSAVYLPLTHVTTLSVARPQLGPVPFGAMANEIPFERIGKAP